MLLESARTTHLYWQLAVHQHALLIHPCDKSKAMKNVVLAASAVAGLVAAASILDMVTGMPFRQQILMDVMFIISAGIVMYMGWDSYKDLT